MVAYSTEESLDILWFNFSTGQIRKVGSEFNNQGALNLKFQQSKLYAILTTGKLLIYDYSNRQSLYLNMPEMPELGCPTLFDVSFSQNFILIGSQVNQKAYVVSLDEFKSSKSQKKSSKIGINLCSLQKSLLVGAKFHPTSDTVYCQFANNQFLSYSPTAEKVKLQSWTFLPYSLTKTYEKFQNIV